MFHFVCVCFCLCRLGKGWLTFSASVLLTFPSEMLSYLRLADRTLSAKRSNTEQMTRLKSQTDLCLRAESTGVAACLCELSLRGSVDEMALSLLLLCFRCTQRLGRFDEDWSRSRCIAWTLGGSRGLIALGDTLRRGVFVGALHLRPNFT